MLLLSVTYFLSHQGSWLKLKSFKEIQVNTVQAFLRNKNGEEGEYYLAYEKNIVDNSC